MAKKSLGYVELVWICPNCDTKNKGSDRFCASCGAPQPDNVAFEQAVDSQLITDEAKLSQAKAGPDIHCRYCGSRNPAGTNFCTQCGGDLSEGTVRSRGLTIGAQRTGPVEPVICPSCGTPNEPDAAKCRQCGASLTQAQPAPKAKPRPVASPARPTGLGRGGMAIIIIAVVILCAIPVILMIISSQTEAVTGQVNSVNWSRSIAIEGLVPVTYEGWYDQIPPQAAVGSCRQEVRYTQPQPAPNAVEVCGTPYVTDEGSGFGEVVQDCQYEVYEDFCAYTVQEWRQVDTETVRGNNFNVQWPALSLNSSDARPGERAETYEVVFNTEQGQYTYTTRDPAEFAQFQNGGRWNLTINGFNTVVAVEPAN